jgi:hypothetical protein
MPVFYHGRDKCGWIPYFNQKYVAKYVINKLSSYLYLHLHAGLFYVSPAKSRTLPSPTRSCTAPTFYIGNFTAPIAPHGVPVHSHFCWCPQIWWRAKPCFVYFKLYIWLVYNSSFYVEENCVFRGHSMPPLWWPNNLILFNSMHPAQCFSYRYRYLSFFKPNCCSLEIGTVAPCSLPVGHFNVIL